MDASGAAYFVVVGGVNIDLCGKGAAPLIACDSNPGTVRRSFGGVGRNIAHNLSLLGRKTKMLTALGDDEAAHALRADCANAGIDLSAAKTVPDGRTSTYLAITGPEGDMAMALCDAEIAEQITPEYLRENLPLLNGARAVVLETNLPRPAIEFLAENCTAPLFADPVSVTKAEKLSGVLGRLHTLKPNRIEAQLLSGVAITDEASLRLAAQRLLQTGLKRVFISLGAQGLYCADASRQLRVPCPPTALKNATGGGDAMMAALVDAFGRGMPLGDSARFALCASAIAVEGEDTINPALSRESVLRRMRISFTEEEA